MAMTTLYQITDDILKAFEDLESGDPERIANAEAALEVNAGNLSAKLDSYLAITEELRIKASGVRTEEQAVRAVADQLSDRAERLEKQRQALFDRVQQAMVTLNLRDINTALARWVRKKNPAAVDVQDPTVVPPAFMVTPPAPDPRPDKAAIKAALTAGQQVPGCQLRVGERLEVIR